MLADRGCRVEREGGIVRAGKYLIALAGVGVLAAGCGTVHAGQAGTPDVLAAAVSHTSTQTARIAVTIGVQTQGMSLSYVATGEFDFARSSGMITMAAPVDMTELFVPPKAYVKVSSLSSSLPRGKTWLAIDTRSAGAASSMLGPFGSTDNPAGLLASLSAIAGSERNLGRAVVRGVPVTEYQVNIDPAKMAAKVPASEKASLREFAQSLGKGAIPVDVWVDGQNMVRQLRLSLHMPAPIGASAGLGNFRLSLTIDFYDFGVAVRVSAPPASQVTDMSGTNSVSVGSVGSASASAAASAVPPPSAIPASAPAVSASAPAVSASPAQG
jgi:hypothetical protein